MKAWLAIVTLYSWVSSSTWELVRNAESQACPRPSDQTLSAGELHVHSSSRTLLQWTPLLVFRRNEEGKNNLLLLSLNDQIQQSSLPICVDLHYQKKHTESYMCGFKFMVSMLPKKKHKINFNVFYLNQYIQSNISVGNQCEKKMILYIFSIMIAHSKYLCAYILRAHLSSHWLATHFRCSTATCGE